MFKLSEVAAVMRPLYCVVLVQRPHYSEEGTEVKGKALHLAVHLHSDSHSVSDATWMPPYGGI